MIFDQVFRHLVEHQVIASRKEQLVIVTVGRRGRQLGAIGQFNWLHTFFAAAHSPVVTNATDQEFDWHAGHTVEHLTCGVGHDSRDVWMSVARLLPHAAQTVAVDERIKRFVFLFDPQE